MPTDTPLTRAEILAALKVCEKATKGPWVDYYGGEPQQIGSRVALKEVCDNVRLPGDRAFICLARTVLPKALRALLERAEDSDLLDGAADIRIVDGIGGIDIDEATAEQMPKLGTDSEEAWNVEWRKQFRIALRAAINAPKAQSTEPYCDCCDGTGLMEGWNRRDGNSCPKCKGSGKEPHADSGD